MGETARCRNHQGNTLTIPPEEWWNRGSHLGNFAREGANSYRSACQTSRNVQNKDGKPQAFIGGAPEIYINERKVQDYSVVENLPVTQIKEVKVIHHPGAEYGNNVGCVLLITTKKTCKDSLSWRTPASSSTPT